MGSSESLEAWLSRLIAVPPERIELGLARVEAVYQRLGNVRPAPIVLTVAGTNGKGSTVAFLVAMLRAAGYRVGSYTSPHLFRFNERIVIDGVEASDSEIIDAFRAIDSARGDIALTFFEFATLAAIRLFAAAALDVAVFEVGLGGRLDAVNLLAADAAIVTTIDLDHQQYLGD
ncbi:MAG TPA: Mur ligase family protein, partial [Pseudomonadota bacterium]|nr:Mur ligase family protein [Pseudomonadota bacterium]